MTSPSMQVRILNSRALGWASIIIGIIVMALIMYVLFVPTYLALPTVIIGVGSIVATLLVVVGFASHEQ